MRKIIDTRENIFIQFKKNMELCGNTGTLYNNIVITIIKFPMFINL
jgi:hypothetical protein